MPSHVNGYPIESVNMLQALLTLKPVPIAPRIKINGTITPPMFQLTESEAMGVCTL